MIDIETVTREAFRRRDAHDLDGFLELVQADCEWRSPGVAVRGRREIRALLEPFYRSFSDDRHELVGVSVIGSRAYVEGSWRATHTAPLATPQGELPATGREVELPFAIAVEADESGLARSIRAYWDGQTLLEQLAAPADPHARSGPEAIVLEGFRRMDSGDVRGFAELFADDVDFVIPGARASTPDGVAALVRAYVDAFPDGRHEPVRLESFGDTALVEGYWGGTHTGPLLTPDGELPASGASVRFRFCGVIRVRDGRIASLHNYFDQLELLGRLGAMPAMAHA
jgi:ketosteroid isomerase-like protein